MASNLDSSSCSTGDGSSKSLSAAMEVESDGHLYQKPKMKDNMQSLLKNVFQVHLQIVDELKKATEQCEKLRKIKHMLMNRNEELQTGNESLMNQVTSLTKEVYYLKAKMAEPCRDCQSYQEKLKLQEILSSLVVSKEGQKQNSIGMEPNSNTSVSPGTCAPAADQLNRNEIAGGSSEDKPKNSKLARSDRLAKCRYIEESIFKAPPAVDHSSDAKAKSACGVKLANLTSADGVGVHASDACEQPTSTGDVVTVGKPAAKLEPMKPDIILPETVPVDSVEVCESEDLLSVGVLNDSEKSTFFLPPQESPTASQQSNGLGANQLNAAVSPGSPVFNRSHRILTTSTLNSPSLFDDLDERHFARGQQIVESSPLPATAVSTSVSVLQSPCPTPRDALARRHRSAKPSHVSVDVVDNKIHTGLNSAFNTKDQSILSQPSPSVLSGKLDIIGGISLRRQQQDSVSKSGGNFGSNSHQQQRVASGNKTSKPDTSHGSESLKGSRKNRSPVTVVKQSEPDSCFLSKDNHARLEDTRKRAQNLAISVVDSPAEIGMDELSFSANVLQSLVSMQTAADGINPNGLLAAGISLSQYTDSEAVATDDVQSFVDELNEIETLDDVFKVPDQVVTRSQLPLPSPVSMQMMTTKNKRPRLQDDDDLQLNSTASHSQRIYARDRPLKEVGNIDYDSSEQASIHDIFSEKQLLEGLGGMNDSFDRVPKPVDVNYQYVEVVRKRHLRQQMDAFPCLQCKQWFDGQDLSKEEVAERMKRCRHKARSEPTSTPAHYWSVGFPTTQQFQKGSDGEKQNKPVYRRKRGLRQLFESGAATSDEKTVHMM